MDLKVASLLIRSPLSHGLQRPDCDVPVAGAFKDLSMVANAVFGSTSANADEGFRRFLPLDCCSTGELQRQTNDIQVTRLQLPLCNHNHLKIEIRLTIVKSRNRS